LLRSQGGASRQYIYTPEVELSGENCPRGLFGPSGAAWGPLGPIVYRSYIVISGQIG